MADVLEVDPDAFEAARRYAARIGQESLLAPLRCRPGPAPAPAMDAATLAALPAPPVATHRDLGERVIGPALAAALSLLRRRLPGRPFGVLRDGGFLAEILEALAPDTPVGRLWLSRRSCAIAAIDGADDREGLANFLIRMRGAPASPAVAAADLGLPDETPPGDADRPLSLDTLAPFLDWLAASPARRARVADVAATGRRRLLAHLRRQGALDGGDLLLVDVGYAGSVQRLLSQVLRKAGLPMVVRGAYVATSPGALWAMREGGAAAGGLVDLGTPAWFAAPVLRCRDVLEAIATPATGQHLGFTDDGAPCMAPSPLPAAQHAEAAAVRAGAVAATAAGAVPDLATARGLLLRLLTQPTAAEAALLGPWLHEDDLAHGGLRPLAPPTPAGMDVATLLRQPRDRILWPALAAVRDLAADRAALAQAAADAAAFPDRRP